MAGNVKIQNANGKTITLRNPDTNNSDITVEMDKVVVKDANGNVGIGVTPSAWNAATKSIDVTDGTSIVSKGQYIVNGGTNHYYNAAGQYIYISNGYATKFSHEACSYIWKTAPSGTAGNAITWNTAMTLASSGNLLVGTSTDNGVDKLQVNGSIGATKSNLRTGVQYGTSSTLTVTVPTNAAGTLCINAYYNGNQAHTWTLPWTYYTDSAKAVGTPLSAGNATLISSAVINNGGNIVVTLANSGVYLSYSLSITN